MSLSEVDVREAVFSASAMTMANLHWADLTDAMADQINFQAADLSNAVFAKTTMLRSPSGHTDTAGTDFSNVFRTSVSTCNSLGYR